MQSLNTMSDKDMQWLRIAMLGLSPLGGGGYTTSVT